MYLCETNITVSPVYSHMKPVSCITMLRKLLNQSLHIYSLYWILCGNLFLNIFLRIRKLLFTQKFHFIFDFVFFFSPHGFSIWTKSLVKFLKRNVMLRSLIIIFLIWVAGLTVLESTELEVDICSSDSNPTTYQNEIRKCNLLWF